MGSWSFTTLGRMEGLIGRVDGLVMRRDSASGEREGVRGNGIEGWVGKNPAQW